MGLAKLKDQGISPVRDSERYSVITGFLDYGLDDCSVDNVLIIVYHDQIRHVVGPNGLNAISFLQCLAYGDDAS